MGGNSQYCLAEEARQKVLDDFGWTITDGGKAEDCIEPQLPFITTWKTDKPGISDDNQIKITTVEGEIYNYSINWGDGSTDTGVTGNITHTFASPGTYQVSISGEFPRILFFTAGSSDPEKLISIDQWGDIAWSSMESAFYFCRNLEVLATDSPDLSNVNKLVLMFAQCNAMVGNQSFNNWDVSNVIDMGSMFTGSAFNQDIGNWNVENVLNMSGMFKGSPFNQDISSWNVGSVFTMYLMLDDTNLSQENYDKLLLAWSELPQLQSNIELGASNSNYCLGEEARQKLIDDFGWTITDGGRALDCFPCPITQITLSTQQQVDNFATTYDVTNCTFEGGILIEGADIVNLDGLSGLTDIDGFLSIVNTTLTNLDGLSSLTESGKFSISNNAFLIDMYGLSSLKRVLGDLVIQNNASLENLDGLSSLLGVVDSLIIQNNASLINLDGLTSFIFIDNDLIIESNPMLENLDGLSSLDGVQIFIYIQSLSIQSNASLTNLDGLSAITNYGDLYVINNDMLTNLAGLSSLRSISRNFNISENNALSDCAIDAVCDSDTIVGGTITISDNTGNCADVTVAKAACVQVEAAADLIAATFLQGSGNPEPTGPILRAEEGNREIYLKFDLSSFSGPITLATLQMQVASDPGNGTLEVFQGSNSNWTETGLNGSNKPVAMGSPLATISGTHSLGQTKTWNLDVSQLTSGGEITLIVKHSNGNDVAFASDETSQAPQLLITSGALFQRPFITTWKTDNPGISAENQVTIRTFPGETYNYSINWGDGNSDTNVAGDIVHTYAASGTYEIAISGNFPQIYMDGYADSKKLLFVNQWGDIKWGSMQQAFASCANLEVVAIDVPDLSAVTSMLNMFSNCDILVGNRFFNNWDVSNVTGMYQMFAHSSFNSDISNWNVAKVTDMIGMFRNTSFNQNIGNWDVGNLKRMSLMFESNSSFNQDIGNWNVSKVIEMGSVFQFSRAFNQDLSRWDVSNVQYMGSMFSLASSFNQDLSSWNVSNVEYMRGMFSGAYSFDQNLGSWNIGNIIDMDFMFSGVKLSTTNYDATLSGWSTQQLQNGVIFGGGISEYCQGEAARQNLIDNFGWIITDGGKSGDCVIVEASADLIDATFLQGSSNPEPTGPILRAEEGNREIYLKFDLSSFNGDITEAQLEMQVASDPGNGVLEVFLGSNSDWSESGLNGSNKPIAIGNAIASISGTHPLGQTKTWNMNVSQINGGGLITLIVKHSAGNDVAFASDETNFAPKLTVTSEGSSTGSGAILSGKSTNILSLSPNPAVVETTLSLKEPSELVMIYVYDVLGRMVSSYEGSTIENNGDYILDVQNVPAGTYYIKSYDVDGNAYQKQMIIMK